MFTKENTITLPLMILLYEFSFFEAKKKVLNWEYAIALFLAYPIYYSFNNAADQINKISRDPHIITGSRWHLPFPLFFDPIKGHDHLH